MLLQRDEGAEMTLDFARESVCIIVPLDVMAGAIRFFPEIGR
jgi:hypothetical protein